MVLGAMLVGGMVGHYAARRQYDSMAEDQARQEQIYQAQQQAAQATQAAQAAQAQAARTAQQQQGPKKDVYQELQKLAGLKQQGIITEEEFQKMKQQLISSL